MYIVYFKLESIRLHQVEISSSKLISNKLDIEKLQFQDRATNKYKIEMKIHTYQIFKVFMHLILLYDKSWSKDFDIAYLVQSFSLRTLQKILL